MPKQGEVNPVWMLRFAQHDKCGVIPNALFCHSERERGIQCDVDASLRLRFAQHDKCGVIPSALFCHSERERGIQCDVDASLRLRSVQHDKCGVIPNAVRNPVHGCFASLSMTSWGRGYRTSLMLRSA
jgi:hypothetical protein